MPICHLSVVLPLVVYKRITELNAVVADLEFGWMVAYGREKES